MFSLKLLSTIQVIFLYPSSICNDNSLKTLNHCWYTCYLKNRFWCMWESPIQTVSTNQMSPFTDHLLCIGNASHAKSKKRGLIEALCIEGVRAQVTSYTTICKRDVLVPVIPLKDPLQLCLPACPWATTLRMPVYHSSAQKYDPEICERSCWIIVSSRGFLVSSSSAQHGQSNLWPQMELKIAEKNYRYCTVCLFCTELELWRTEGAFRQWLTPHRDVSSTGGYSVLQRSWMLRHEGPNPVTAGRSTRW